MLLIVDCAPNSKEYNMKYDHVVLRDASEAPCSYTLCTTSSNLNTPTISTRLKLVLAS
jgi:hypothetical protein